MEKETENNQINYEDKYIRLYSDFENYKKRVLKEKDDIKKSTILSIIDPILEMDNDINIALDSIRDESSDGLNLIASKVDKVLDKLNVTRIDLDKYDPDIHEVISISGNSGEFKTLSNGYKIGDTIVKYPKIILI